MYFNDLCNNLRRDMFTKAYGLIVIPLLMVSLFIPQAPTSPIQVTASPKAIIYNLYATDAYIPLADGSAVYNYGFVGGRQGDALTYQKSVTPGATRNVVTGLAASFTYNGNGTVPAGAPAPTSGMLTGAEKELQGNAQFPAPLIYTAVGDVLEIRLKNLGTTNPAAANDPQSIHLHGLDEGHADGSVSLGESGAIPANLCADGTSAPKGENCAVPAPDAGNVIVYMAAPRFAGETMWQSDQEAGIHSQMGMYGALVVYSAEDRLDPDSAYNHGGPGGGYGGTINGWSYDKDYVLLESEISPYQHISVEARSTYNPNNYHPTYWALNGLSFPNTMHLGLPGNDGWKDWIDAHPGYDPLVTGSVSGKSSGDSQGDKILIRMINVNYEIHPAYDEVKKVSRSDPCAGYADKTHCDAARRANSSDSPLTLGSGEAYEWLIDFGEQFSPSATHPLDTQTHYHLVDQTSQTDLPVIQDAGGNILPDPAFSTVMGIGGGRETFSYYNHAGYTTTPPAYPDGLFAALMPLP
jgi:hypothetical protein